MEGSRGKGERGLKETFVHWIFTLQGGKLRQRTLPNVLWGWGCTYGLHVFDSLLQWCCRESLLSFNNSFLLFHTDSVLVSLCVTQGAVLPLQRPPGAVVRVLWLLGGPSARPVLYCKEEPLDIGPGPCPCPRPLADGLHLQAISPSWP